MLLSQRLEAGVGVGQQGRGSRGRVREEELSPWRCLLSLRKSHLRDTSEEVTSEEVTSEGHI